MEIIREIISYCLFVVFILGIPAFLIGLFTRFTKK